MEKITQDSYKLYINGQWIDASDGATFQTRCPANGEGLATCAQATREDVDQAVDAAWAAFRSWKNVTTNERAAILNRIADIIDANAEHLAMIESLDNGKPIRETMTIDIPYASRHFRYFAGCIMAEEGSANILDGSTLSLILREPIGVVGQIVPWNFPFLMAAWKLAPVLAAGCCTVFKPSSDTPLSVLELARLLTPWTGRLTVHVVPFTAIQEELRRSCPEELFTVIMRRFMMRIAQEVAQLTAAQAALEDGRRDGTVSSLRYLREDAEGGAVRLAFADRTWERENLLALLRTCLLVGLLGLACFFVISLLLSTLALRPAERSWQQQKQFVSRHSGWKQS